ncbi:MAG: mechanosensitive ion channel [Polyangiales bacterium]
MYLIDALERALSRVIQFIPSLMAAFLILAIGWLIAEGLGTLTTRLLSRTELDERLVRYDVVRPGAQAPSKTTGRAVFWLIFLVALASAVNMLGIPAVEGVIALFVGYIANLVAAAAILGIGYVVARFLSRVATRLVESNRLDERIEGQPIGSKNVSRATSAVVFWGIFLVALGAAADALHIVVVSQVISALVAYLPHFVLAAVMIGVGVAIGGWVKSLVLRRGKSASTEFAGSAAKSGIIVLAAFMAANELGIGSTIVTIAFVMVLGAAAVAFAIAFGLGSRDVANRVARDWYERAQRITREPRPPAFRPSTPSAS